jgi:hypothetical protein
MTNFREEFLKGKKPTSETHVKGLGTVRSFGECDFEKLLKLLLKNKNITG